MTHFILNIFFKSRIQIFRFPAHFSYANCMNVNKFKYATRYYSLKRFDSFESIGWVIFSAPASGLNFFNILAGPCMYNKFFASYSGCRLARYCSQSF
jgi:hypothetical protein